MKKEYAQYLLNKTKRNYNLFSKDFSRARERIWDEMKFLFNDYLIAGERVLDLGCGNGRFCELFEGQNIDYIGVDISEKLIAIAKKRYPNAKFQKVDALNLPFPENFFDKVYSIAVLHHIPSQEFRKRFLKEIKRVLKPRGVLILTVWNLWQKRKTRRLISKFILRRILGKSKLGFKDILMNWQKMENCYFHCFTKGELEKLITKAGFHLKRSGEILVGREVKKLPNSNFYIIAEK